MTSKDGSKVVDDLKLKECLAILAGDSDEHKFAGLLMVAKHLQTEDEETLQYIRIEVLRTAGVEFFIRLLHTKGSESDEISPFQSLALNLIASFCQDAQLAKEFASDQVVSIVFDILPIVLSTPNSILLHDCIHILQGIHSFEVFDKQNGWETLAHAIHEYIKQDEFHDGNFITLVHLMCSATNISIPAFSELCEIFSTLQTPTKGKCILQELLVSHLTSDELASALLTTSNRVCISKGLFGVWPAHTHHSTRRDTSLRLIDRVLVIHGNSWLFDIDPSTSVPLVGIILHMAAIESKLLLDEAELLLIDMEIQNAEKKTQSIEIELARIHLLLPACYSIAEATIAGLMEPDRSISLSHSLLLQLKETLGEMFTVIIQFLTTCRDATSSATYIPPIALEDIIVASIRVLGAWMAEETDLLENQLIDLIPFLVLYQSHQNEMDSDDEMDEPSKDFNMLPFLLPGLLQLSATESGAARIAKNDSVLQRILHFTAAVCGRMHDAIQDGVGTLTICLGISLNVLLLSNMSDTIDDIFQKALPLLQSLTVLTWKHVMNENKGLNEEPSDEFQLLLHLVVVTTLVAKPSNVMIPCIQWIKRNPPSIDHESNYDLHQLAIHVLGRHGI